MNSFKLAVRNIKKSVKDYSIYFITLLIGVALFYVFNAVDSQSMMIQLDSSSKATMDTLVEILGYISVFVAFVLGFLVVYANNFIVKRRKKEIGLYMTLGMSKFKVSTVLVFETFLIGLVSLVLGIVIGIGISQLIAVFTAYLFEVDVTSFNFVISTSGLIKTIYCFALIFVIVMIFNIISLSHIKLINLLKAKSVNEKMRIKNPVILLIIFIASLVLIGYGYHLLNSGALTSSGNESIIMLICGSIGTYLFFYSVSAFIIRIIKLFKRVYYHGVNVFALKQLEGSIQSNVFSMTVISLMLLLTIGILSTSLSLASSINDSVEDMYPAGYRIVAKSSDSTQYVQDLTNDKEFQSYSKESHLLQIYNSDDAIISKFLPKTGEKYYPPNYKIQIMLESDYNALVKMYGNTKSINLNNKQYALICTFNMTKKMHNEFLKQDGQVSLNNNTLTPISKKCLSVNVTSSGIENGIMVVDDSYKDSLKPIDTFLIGMFNKNMTINSEEKFAKIVDSNKAEVNTKQKLIKDERGGSVIFTYIGLYLGLIFAIESGTVLAIEQLSKTADNKDKYLVLKQLGASRKMRNHALFIQVGLSFLFPLVVGLVHSFVGISEINRLIQLILTTDLTKSILKTALFIIIVYGGYFLSTYFASVRIINEKE